MIPVGIGIADGGLVARSEAMQGAFGSSAGQAVMDDATTFLNLAELSIMVVDETEVLQTASSA